MGDNRDNSADSRVAAPPSRASAARCRGRISAAAPSSSPSRYDGSSKWLNPISWFSALRGGRAGTSLRPQRRQEVSDGPAAGPRAARASSASRRRGCGRRADGHVEQPGPTELRDPFIREELKRASVWFGLALAILAIIFLAQPLLLIFAGIVLASMLDGGTRLLGRVLPIRRGFRLAIVTLAVVAFVLWAFYYSGKRARRPGRAAAHGRDRCRSTGSSAGPGELGLVPSDINVGELTSQISGQLMGTLGKARLGRLDRGRRAHQR